MQDKQRLVRIATYASVSVAILLVAIKFYAWLRTDSASVLASLLDSAFDIIASLMILVAVAIAQIPADSEHRFGHGKAEPLAAFAQSVFISGSALYLIFYALEQLWNQTSLTHVHIGLWAMFLSLALTIALVIFQKYVFYQTRSTAIEADALHYLSDVLTTGLVIVSLFLSETGWLDPVFAIVIALWILRSAFKIAQGALNQLLDREIPDEMRNEIRNLILQHPQVKGFNDFRSYQSGPNTFVQFDLELDDQLTLRAAHDIAEHVTEQIKARFECIDVMVHQEPASLRHDQAHHQWGRE